MISSSFCHAPRAIASSPFHKRHIIAPQPRLHPSRSRFHHTAPSAVSSNGFTLGTEDFVLSNGMIDYYAVLGIDDKSSSLEIKQAWRDLCKVCHPDISGDETGHNMCILLNEAYEVLSDPLQRTEFNKALDEALADEDDGFTGELLSKWCANSGMGKNADPAESRGVFVDELSCIGCKMCMHVSPATFRIEEEYGRSRVFAQWVDCEDNIQAAMDACPVSCIHWVDKLELAALEYVTQNKVKRVNVGVMMAGQGGGVTDVWDATAKYLKDREQRRRARERASKYSKAQAEARANAAMDLMRQQQGWWFSSIADKLGINDAASKMYASMEAVSRGSESEEDEYANYQRVGRRRRTRMPDASGYGARGDNGGKVPTERALVPAALGKRAVWEKRKY